MLDKAIQMLAKRYNIVKMATDMLDSIREVLTDTDVHCDVPRVEDGKIKVLITAETTDPIKAEKLDKLKTMLKAFEEKHPTIFSKVEVVLETKFGRHLLMG